MLENKGKSLKVYHNANNPIVDIYRFDFSANTENPLIHFGQIVNSDFPFNKKSLLSYSFNRNVNDLYGTFELQVKEDEDSKYFSFNLILDNVQPMDVIKIYDSGDYSKLNFIGVVNTVSFGATAGAYNKSITISGKSISSLFEMFQVSTDRTNMAFYCKNESNKLLVDELSNLCKQNNDKGTPVKQAIYTVFDEFTKIATNPEYSKIAASGIFSMIDFYFGKDFVSCADNLVFGYPVSRNLFNEDNTNIYSYFKGLLPDAIYEFFETIENNKPLLKVREKPFEDADFQALYEENNNIDPVLITDYTLSRSNEEVYTCFLSSVQGSGLNAETWKIISESENAQDALSYDIDKIKIYGYRPLVVDFLGYSNADSTDESKNKAKEEFKNLSLKLKRWYLNLDKYLNGSISMILLRNAENKILLGKVVRFCKGGFYVTNEKHSWSYGGSVTSNLQLERGGNYSDKTGKFSPLEKLSAAYAELLLENDA